MKWLGALVSLFLVMNGTDLFSEANAQPHPPTPIADPLDAVKPLRRSSLDIGVIDDITPAKRRGVTTETLRAEMEQYLLIRIDELNRNCKLSEEQLNELRTAIEPAVQQAMEGKPTRREEWKTDRTKPQRWVSVTKYYAVHPAPTVVAQQKAWTSAVDKVLNEEQKAADQEAQVKRLARMRRIEVEALVAAIDERLLLSAEQRKKIEDLVTKTIESQSRVVAPGQVFTLSGQPNVPGGVSIALNLPQFGQQFPPDAFAKILSPAQLKRWEELLRPRGQTPVIVPSPQ